MDRVILHCDMNSFYASIELLDHPELRHVPTAVSGNPKNRHGIILAKNDAAKAFGVKTAETIWQARKKCPDLVLLPPHHETYHLFHEKINHIFLQYTDLVEPFSIDESWLDVTGSQALFGSGKEIADTIRRRVREELGLTLSAGVSFNKIFAKMGSEYRKPDATTVITRENYPSILWPLPVSTFFFVGQATAARLSGIGIETIGDLAHAQQDVLVRLLGKQGIQLHTAARGEDQSPVRRYDASQPAKSIGNGITFPADLREEREIRAAVISLSDKVAGRLRANGLLAHGVKVSIKDPDFHLISRQMKLELPTQLASDLSRAAMHLIHASVPSGNPIRLLSITAIQLSSTAEPEQMNLFSLLEEQTHSPQHHRHNRESDTRMEETMDDIRSRFGNDAIGFGTALSYQQKD